MAFQLKDDAVTLVRDSLHLSRAIPPSARGAFENRRTALVERGNVELLAGEKRFRVANSQTPTAWVRDYQLQHDHPDLRGHDFVGLFHFGPEYYHVHFEECAAATYGYLLAGIKTWVSSQVIERSLQFIRSKETLFMSLQAPHIRWRQQTTPYVDWGDSGRVWISIRIRSGHECSTTWSLLWHSSASRTCDEPSVQHAQNLGQQVPLGIINHCETPCHQCRRNKHHRYRRQIEA